MSSGGKPEKELISDPSSSLFPPSPSSPPHYNHHHPVRSAPASIRQMPGPLSNDLALFGHAVRRIDAHYRAQGVVVDWAGTAALHLGGGEGRGNRRGGGDGGVLGREGGPLQPNGEAEQGGVDDKGDDDDGSADDDDDDDDAIERLVMPSIPTAPPSRTSATTASPSDPRSRAKTTAGTTRDKGKKAASAAPAASSPSQNKANSTCTECGRLGPHRRLNRDHGHGHVCTPCYNRQLRAEKRMYIPADDGPQEMDEDSDESAQPKRPAPPRTQQTSAKKARTDADRHTTDAVAGPPQQQQARPPPEKEPVPTNKQITSGDDGDKDAANDDVYDLLGAGLG
ncbi:hypothetical protein OC835_006321 [Tilletia horrida]|nr:hypothetical protein OC835_006321 [Tilletia horrida]